MASGANGLLFLEPVIPPKTPRIICRVIALLAVRVACLARDSTIPDVARYPRGKRPAALRSLSAVALPEPRLLLAAVAFSLAAASSAASVSFVALQYGG